MNNCVAIRFYSETAEGKRVCVRVIARLTLALNLTLFWYPERDLNLFDCI